MQAEEVAVYREGERQTYAVGEEKFGKIIAAWNRMTENALTMPAFGVSLNDLTVDAMKSGVWAEFCFGKQLTVNEMPFERLLIEVKPQNAGFNIVRYTTTEGYSGRCFYLDLAGGDMSDFYNAVTK